MKYNMPSIEIQENVEYFFLRQNSVGEDRRNTSKYLKYYMEEGIILFYANVRERNLPSRFQSVGLQVFSGDSQGPQESVKVSSRPKLFSQNAYFFSFFPPLISRK